MNNTTADLRQPNQSVTSADGARIYYRQVGQGPGLIIVPGAATESAEYLPLADELAGDFTVYIPDRRGCGQSTPPDDDYSIIKEREDLQSLITATKAKFLFGHSSGGIICLETAMKTPIRKLAVFEPPLSWHNSVPSSWISEYMEAIEQGDQARGMVVALKGGMRFNNSYWLPRWFLIPFVRHFVLKTAPTANDLKMAATWPLNMKLVWATDSTYPKYKKISAPALLLGGTTGPKFLQDALGWLEQTLPHHQREVMAGLDHGGPTQEGDPKQVAERLREFYHEG